MVDIEKLMELHLEKDCLALSQTHPQDMGIIFWRIIKQNSRKTKQFQRWNPHFCQLCLHFWSNSHFRSISKLDTTQILWWKTMGNPHLPRISWSLAPSAPPNTTIPGVRRTGQHNRSRHRPSTGSPAECSFLATATASGIALGDIAWEYTTILRALIWMNTR